MASIWVIEENLSGDGKRWDFVIAFATRKEAKEWGWEAVPPNQQRIVKYVRKEAAADDK